MLRSDDIKSIDIYASQIRRYSLLTRQQEIQSFRDIDAKEDEYLRALGEQEEAISSALTEIQSASKKDKHRDKALRDFNEAVGDSATRFLSACRSNATLRSMPPIIHPLVIKYGSRPSTQEWVTRLNRAKRELDTLRCEFAKRNLRLVISVARKYSYLCRGIKVSDLIQEGNIGLMRSIEKFDTRIEVRFATYASWWIRQSIVRALIDKNKSVRIPVHIYDKVLKIRRYEARFISQNSRPPTDEEVAKELSTTAARVKKIRENDVDTIDLSLDAPMEEEGDKLFIDFMEGEDGNRPLEEMRQSNLKARLDAALECLTPRERFVITERYGYGGNSVEDKTLEEVGETFKVSRERIRQIQSDAFRKMRPRLSRELLDP